MKKIIKILLAFIKKIILWFLQLFGISFKTNNRYKEKKLINKKKNLAKQTHKEILTSTKESASDTARTLKKEDFIKDNVFLPTKEDLEKIFYTFIEKTFKRKVSDLQNEEREKLIQYEKKTIQKIIPKIARQEITTEEAVEKILEENLKKDLQKKNLNLESLLLSTKPSLETKQETFEENQKRNDKNTEKKKENITNLFEKNTSLKPIELIEIQREINQKNSLSSSPKSLEFLVQETKDRTSQNEENRKETIFNSSEPKTESNPNNDEKINNEVDVKANQIKKEMPEPIKISPVENKITEKQKKKENKDLEKNSEKYQLILNIATIELENNILIEEAKQEYNKEELIDKNYEEIEELLEKKIKEIETMLEKPLNELQKNKLKRELEKLKESEKNLLLFKEKDLEELRKSLEENIPLEELMIITEKLNQFSKNEEIKRKENLYKDIEKKTQREIQEMEKVLIKEAFKQSLRKLEIAFFFSFPFIKNKHLKRFISGLFIFRTFGFIKNILFGFPESYEPIDLSYIQKGSDALEQSIALTEQNIFSFKNLKQNTLLKYPELIEDELFMKDLNKLEEQLKKNHEKLLQQEQLVNKYFDKSKILIRKRKRSNF